MHFFTKSPQYLDNVFIVGEKTGIVAAQSCSNGSSEGGKFDEDINVVLLLGPVHAISKHKPSLGISVANFNRKSLSADDDIRRPVCILVDRVFDKSDAASQVYRNFLLDDCLEGRKNVHGSAFVQKHVKHSSS